MILRRSTTVSEYALIRVLAISQRRQLDPATLVAQLAMDFPGASGQRMAQFASLLSKGYSVVDALQLVRGILDPALVMALRLSSDAGVLSQTYETLLAESEGDDLQTSDCLGRFGADLLRVVLVFLFAGSVASFTAIWILPTFIQMFEEFELELPQLMLLTISLTRELQLEQTRWLLEAGLIRGVTQLRNRPDYRGETWSVAPALNEYVVATVQIAVSTKDAPASQLRLHVTARIQEKGLTSKPTQRSDSWLVDLPKSESTDENTNP